jgi:hypothetical protein
MATAKKRQRNSTIVTSQIYYFLFSLQIAFVYFWREIKNSKKKDRANAKINT